MARQVQALEDRFQLLHAENSRMKSELLSALRQVDSFAAECSQKDASLRQTQYKLEDMEHQASMAEDALQRQLQTSKLEVVICRDQLSKLLASLSRDIEKVFGITILNLNL